MNRRIVSVMVLAIALYLSFVIGCKTTIAAELPAPKTSAPLFEQLNTLHHRISTKSRLAQRYFDQGLLLTFGFNHPEALRSFQAAAEIDPNCAMCYWGIAYVWGPNINAAMATDAIPTAWAAIQKAVTLSDHASPAERAYIEALTKRYHSDPESDRTLLNQHYADAMREVVQQYPNDLDAATLFAETLMDTSPWNYWQDDGEPNTVGEEIIHTLDTVLKRDRNHPGALHYYIHAVEKKRPDLAVDVADRLRDLQIPIGHLLHMPSHIYLRVGRYEDAIASNQQAIAADQEYAKKYPNENIYTDAYMPHNYHFLWYAATMAGQKQIALDAAQNTAALVNQRLVQEPGYGTLQHYLSIPVYTDVKFERWDEILATPAPQEDLVYPTGVWHYARGMALSAKGRISEAAKELRELRAIATNPALDGVTLWDINQTADLLKIGADVLAGEIASQQGNFEAAIRFLEAAVHREDDLRYDEPPPWYSPVRESLAAVLVKAEKPATAQQVYRQDLAMYPNNRWSSRGLALLNERKSASLRN